MKHNQVSDIWMPVDDTIDVIALPSHGNHINTVDGYGQFVSF